MKRFLFFIPASLCFTVLMQAQVSKTVNVIKAGTLHRAFTKAEMSKVSNLEIMGNLDARDFKTMCDMPELTSLNIHAVNIVEHKGRIDSGLPDSIFAANTIPAFIFMKNAMKQNKLITSITLPSSVTLIGANTPIGWSASSNADWLKVTPALGTNDGSLTITVLANTCEISRTGTISISLDGYGNRIIGVTQAGVLGSDIHDLGSDKIVLLPIPKQNRLYVSSENAAINNISVVDASGRKVFDVVGLPNNGFIDYSSISSGEYFVRIQTEKKIWVKKVLKD